MKVLSIIWGFCGGGIDKVVMTYTNLNQFSDIDLETVCIYGQNWNTKHKEMEEYNIEGIMFRNRLDFSWIAKTAKLIKEKNPDLVFVHGFNGPVVAMLCRFYLKEKFPFVCSYHGLYHAPKLSRLPLQPIFNGVLHYLYRHKAKAIVAVAEHSRKFLISKKVPAEKITTIHNGLPKRPKHKTFPTRKECGFTDDNLVIGVISRLHPIKGLDYLIKAFADIFSGNLDLRLLIVGRGPDENKLKNLCSDYGINDKVFFAGYQDNADAWLDLIDIYLLPSLSECHSMGLLEAMRAGKAIVATDVGGNPESVEDKKQALLISPADSVAIRDAVIRLIKDKGLRKKLAISAKKRFEPGFTVEYMLKRTAEWLRKQGQA